MIIREYNDEFYDYDDSEYESGDIRYEAKAYYQKTWRGLADSAKFSNIYDLRDWISNMVQSGFFVEVYDYEDGEYRYYAWPDNAEDFDITDVDELEIDRNGDFFYLDGALIESRKTPCNEIYVDGEYRLHMQGSYQNNDLEDFTDELNNKYFELNPDYNGEILYNSNGTVVDFYVFESMYSGVIKETAMYDVDDIISGKVSVDDVINNLQPYED